MIKIVLQEWFWCLVWVLWSEKSNDIITNDSKGHIQGQRVIFQGQIAWVWLSIYYLI